MLDVKLLEALAAVVELGSFEKAAERLRVTQSAISQRIKQLESRVGWPVVVRSEGRATAAGERLLCYARQVQALEQEALASLGVTSLPWRRLTIAVNSDSLATWFANALNPTIARRGVLVDLVVGDHARTIEHLRSGAVLACVSSHAHPVQGCSAQLLGRMRYICAAAPTALGRTGQRLDHAFAASVPVIQSGDHDEIVESFMRRALALDRFQYPYHVIPSSTELLAFTLAGHGYSVLPECQIASHLTQGKLVDLAPSLSLDIELYWHRWKTSTDLLDDVSHSVIATARQCLR